MTKVLLALAMMVSASSAFAAQYKGEDNNRDVCYITVQKGAGGTKIALADINGNTGLQTVSRVIHSSDRRVVTYVVYRNNKPTLDVAVHDSGHMTSTRYAMRSNYYCTVR